jgi:hypothetical protein
LSAPCPAAGSWVLVNMGSAGCAGPAADAWAPPFLRSLPPPFPAAADAGCGGGCLDPCPPFIARLPCPC